MKLEIPIQITAADSIKRTIAGRIVSFNETANASTGKVMFTDGSLIPAPVKLNLEHDGTRPIGKSMSMDFSNDKSSIDGVFKIANTTAGSDALVEAQDGLRDGFSVEVMANEFTYQNDGTMVVSSGEIVGVALVTNPAFKSAASQMSRQPKQHPKLLTHRQRKHKQKETKCPTQSSTKLQPSRRLKPLGISKRKELHSLTQLHAWSLQLPSISKTKSAPHLVTRTRVNM